MAPPRLSGERELRRDQLNFRPANPTDLVGGPGEKPANSSRPPRGEKSAKSGGEQLAGGRSSDLGWWDRQGRRRDGKMSRRWPFSAGGGAGEGMG